jgi:hypothetical protein
MQHLDLDPDRPHGLNDLIDRMNTELSWTPSWDDVCRVREYVGAGWPRHCSNDYSFASLVLYHLADVDKAHTTIAPYVTIACALHKAAIGAPCAHQPYQSWVRLDGDVQLPTRPVVCTWRVLSKHDRRAALEIFERRSPASAPASGTSSPSLGRDILPISAESLSAVAIARVQYRGPQPLVPDRIVVSGAGNWMIHDVRVGGTSIFAPHLDLPGSLFGNDTMGPLPLLPVIEQDQWIEVEAHCIRGNAPWFRAAIIGNTRQEKETMNSPADTDTFKKSQEQREQQVIEHLAACERIRKRLELPIEALALIDRSLRGDHEFGRLLTPRPSVEPSGRATRSPLRLLSEKKIKPTDPITGRPTPVHVRPQTLAMRVEEIEILSEPGHWMIADVQVGTRTQFPQWGPPLPGRLFTPGGTCHHFVTEAIQTAMDFTLLVHYVGPEGEGSIFEAVAMGSHVY